MSLPNTAAAFLWRFVKQQKPAFLMVIAVAIFWVVNETFFPFFLKKIVNQLEAFQGVRTEVYHSLTGVLVLLGLFWLISEILLRLQGILLIYVFPRFRAHIREQVFNYIQAHSHDYFANEFAGNIGKKLADLPTCSQAALEIICFNFIPTLVSVIIILVMMWNTQPIFAYIVFIWVILHLGITSLFLRYGNQAWALHSDKEAILSGKIIDILTNMTTARLFGRSRYELAYMQKYQDDEIAQSRKAMWAMELTRIGLGINGLFLVFSMIYLLLHGWVQGWVSLGDFTQVAMQSFWLLGWIWMVSFQMTVFARHIGTIQGALSIIIQEHDIVDVPLAQTLQIKKGEVILERISFAYQRKQMIFDELSLSIPAGQKIGLVGFSGSGKTTLVNLILRFYDLDSGRILIDGQDIRAVTQDSLRTQIAMIPQDPSLFHRTLMENIRYGRLDASDAEVIAAAKIAHCHEFIKLLPQQYETLVGERGIKLSGGQRQRIAIARALLKNAPILILDEATSSLDSVTEKLIQESLQLLMRGRTTLIIAHRLSTLADMDRILVFHQGKIVEDGTRDELLKLKGHFAKLWNSQTDGFLPN